VFGIFDKFQKSESNHVKLMKQKLLSKAFF